MADTIKFDEWIAELEKLEKQQPGGFSTQDLADHLGIAHQTARGKVKRWQKAGHVRLLPQKRRDEDMCGRPCYVPVYERVK